MATESLIQVLQQEIETLSDELALEALDYIQFLKSRREEEAFLWEQVEETRAYRHLHPDAVVTLSAEEWMSTTAHLEDVA